MGGTAMRRLLLVCGILSTLLYLLMNVFIPMQWDGYSRSSQVISELSAIDAPTRGIWVPLGIVYTLLIAAFGAGVWAAAYGNRKLRIGGILLMFSGVFGLFWPPMHLRGEPFSLTDALHIAWSAVTLLIMLAVMGLAAASLGKRFRLYTIATVVLWLVFGTLTFLDSPEVASGDPTPWIGVWERINVGAYMSWLVLFALVLLQREAMAVQRSRFASASEQPA